MSGNNLHLEEIGMLTGPAFRTILILMKTIRLFSFIFFCSFMVGCASKIVVDDLKLKSIQRVEKNANFSAPMYKIVLISNYSLKESSKWFYGHESFCDLKIKYDWWHGNREEQVLLGAGSFQEGKDFDHSLYPSETTPQKQDREVEYEIYIHRSQPANSKNIPPSIAFDLEQSPQDVCIYFGTAGYGRQWQTNTVRIPKNEFAESKTSPNKP